MPDQSDDYLNWYKDQMPRWAAPGMIDLAGSAVSGNVGELDELIERGRHAPAVNVSRGHVGLREELARYFGVLDDPGGPPARDTILTAGGASNGILIALAAVRRLLLVQGETPPRAVVESPTYGPLFSVAEYIGFEMSTFRRRAEDGYRLRPEAVRQSLAGMTGPVVLVVSNLHNPTSAEAYAAEIQSLLAAAPAGSYVVVDETFINASSRRDSVARLADPRIIAIGSLSKDPGLGALRCGWIIAFGATHWEMRRARAHAFNVGSPLLEAAACEAIRALPSMNERTQRLLSTNLEVAEASLAPLRLGGSIKWTPPARGCVIFPELTVVAAKPTFKERRDIVRSFYERALAEAKVAIVPGDLFNPSQEFDADEAHIRIGIGGPTADLRDGLARLAKLIREFSPA